MGSLPKHILVQIADKNNIKVFADDTEFPFDISEFVITYDKDNGFNYSIAAGTIINNKDDNELSYKKSKSILDNDNFRLSPSSTGLLSLEDDESYNEEESTESDNKIKIDTSILYKNNKLRTSFLSDKPIYGEHIDIIRIDTDSIFIKDDSSYDKLVSQLRDNENEFAEEWIRTGRKYKLYPMHDIKINTDDDGSVYLEERFLVYE